MNAIDGNVEKTLGKVFSIGKENPPIPGCTVSKAFKEGDRGITFFRGLSIPTSALKFILTIN